MAMTEEELWLIFFLLHYHYRRACLSAAARAWLLRIYFDQVWLWSDSECELDSSPRQTESEGSKADRADLDLD